ncbi:MAG: tRNA lysidine(34) synthetase TilS [Verrucomicrobiae bacterium]|nr:tRNA lysidine(34) synthetase TilS [Verrucomicrobiae bacterium]NNJ43402.1 tRNA lysidine(34) synthetase TilS [Akkermansiaceae bacterium]
MHPEFLLQSKNRRYLLAISGGRDSVALLNVLLDAGYRNLILCHLNHGLRGAESGQDASFVRRLAKKHDLACEIDRVDVAARMEQTGESMELAARNARHAFFVQCAGKHRCPRFLLAHHADDQVETILFNLLRGSSGLKGMRYENTHQMGGRKLELVRPLLLVSRSEINCYLTTHRIHYREDPSNAEAIATRNRLRNEAIPLLNEIMGREIRPALLRAAAISEAQETALRESITDLRLEDPQGRLFLPKLIKISPVLQKIVLHDYLKAGGVSGISHDLLDRCASLLQGSQASKINLPQDRFLRRKEKRLFID